MGVLTAFGGVRGARAAAHMVVTGVAAFALYRTLKHGTRRRRPFRAHTDIVAHVPPLDEFSFPPGRTLHAVSFSLVAIAYFPVFALLRLPFTMLRVASRFALGRHYPSDVLAAGLIGIALASASRWVVPGASLFA